MICTFVTFKKCYVTIKYFRDLAEFGFGLLSLDIYFLNIYCVSVENIIR